MRKGAKRHETRNRIVGRRFCAGRRMRRILAGRAQRLIGGARAGTVAGAGRRHRVGHRRAAARERFALVDADARAEDRKRAEAAVALAKAELQEARALYEKTFIRAPISGVVLRKRLRAGEIASATATPPTVVVTLGDAARLRVRADVDESDVGKLRVGQAAYVTARAYGDKKFPGRVVKIGQALGRKNFRTEEPTERVDTKILETLIELEAGTALPIGLRVDAFIQ